MAPPNNPGPSAQRPEARGQKPSTALVGSGWSWIPLAELGGGDIKTTVFGESVPSMEEIGPG